MSLFKNTKDSFEEIFTKDGSTLKILETLSSLSDKKGPPVDGFLAPALCSQVTYNYHQI